MLKNTDTIYISSIDQKTNMVMSFSNFQDDFFPIEKKYGDVERADNGAYYLVGYAPAQSLDVARDKKKAEINAMRDEKEQSGFMYDGSFFDSDSISYQRLIGANITASSALAMGAEFTPIEWTLADNTTRLMSAQDFLQIIPAFAQFSATLHYQASSLKSQVDLATTKEEIDAIKWE